MPRFRKTSRYTDYSALTTDTFALPLAFAAKVQLLRDRLGKNFKLVGMTLDPANLGPVGDANHPDIHTLTIEPAQADLKDAIDLAREMETEGLIATAIGVGAKRLELGMLK